ncbi:hypothetical protein OH77DRAFT_511740 [Trametes cingulata]|nr:hypothetical protein OH77DRAFT_511740 [Trametes cingulata]
MAHTRPTPSHHAFQVETWHHPYQGLDPIKDMSLSSAPAREDCQSLLANLPCLERASLSVKAVLNAGVPVNRLPDELLAEIFACLQGGINDPTSTPKLWRLILGEASAAYICTCLVRSKATKLTIARGVVATISLTHFLQLIVPHIHRVGILLLSITALGDVPCAAVPRYMHRVAQDALSGHSAPQRLRARRLHGGAGAPGHRAGRCTPSQKKCARDLKSSGADDTETFVCEDAGAARRACRALV